MKLKYKIISLNKNKVTLRTFNNGKGLITMQRKSRLFGRTAVRLGDIYELSLTKK